METSVPNTQVIYPDASKSSLLTRRDGLNLLLLWGIITLIDVVWLMLDQAPPAWDQGEHLTRALNYWRVLQQPEWLNGDWWQELWLLSPSYRAPLAYLATAPVLTLLGRGFDQAVLVNCLFTPVLLLLVYVLGKRFDRVTGLWAAAFCALIPSLVILRTDYLLDYGLVTVVLAAYGCLTGWLSAGKVGRWLWAVGFGLTLGLTVLAKPTGIIFLALPILWIGGVSLFQKPRWQHGFQWLLAVMTALLVCGFWVKTNWLTILTTSGQSNASWVAAELDLNSWRSVWSYYARMLPRMVTYPLLGMGIAGWIVAIAVGFGQQFTGKGGGVWPRLQWRYVLWLLLYVAGSYLLMSLLKNKDPRHIAPYAPVVVILLTRGLTLWLHWSARLLRLGLLASMMALMLASQFPLTPTLAGRLGRHPYRGEPWPQPEVIQQVLEKAPYLRSTIGVLPNIAQMNPMNVDFYGTLADFRVFGREVGFNPTFAPLDARSLTWALAKTGDQGPQNSGNEAKADLQQQVEQSPDYAVQRTWPLPDGGELRLYHRQPEPISVKPLGAPQTLSVLQVTVPDRAPPGPVPITYTLGGAWRELQDGLLLLDWVPETTPEAQPQWIHDHGIGLGHLYLGFEAERPDSEGFEVVERLAMRIPPDTPNGRYRLWARHLNRVTGEVQNLPIPETVITVDAIAPPPVAPELDLVSQLHQLSQGLATGDLDPVFNTVGRINQYDPIQDYLAQAEQAMTVRLADHPNGVRWLYTRALAQVLQQDAPAAITTLQYLTQAAPENPFHWLYLAFVHLYSWQPGAANQALDEAEALAPDMIEVKALQGVAALQRLNLLRAWRKIQESGLL